MAICAMVKGLIAEPVPWQGQAQDCPWGSLGGHWAPGGDATSRSDASGGTGTWGFPRGLRKVHQNHWLTKDHCPQEVAAI